MGLIYDFARDTRWGGLKNLVRTLYTVRDTISYPFAYDYKADRCHVLLISYPTEISPLPPIQTKHIRILIFFLGSLFLLFLA